MIRMIRNGYPSSYLFVFPKIAVMVPAMDVLEIRTTTAHMEMLFLVSQSSDSQVALASIAARAATKTAPAMSMTSYRLRPILTYFFISVSSSNSFKPGYKRRCIFPFWS